VASRFHMYEYLAARKVEDESPLPPNRHYHLDHPAQGNGGKGGNGGQPKGDGGSTPGRPRPDPPRHHLQPGPDHLDSQISGFF
jgi:hypothetical protein